ncbi:ATP-binding cassette subfamily B protein [Bisgaardia hudsonensis]|uniref:ATP-binding cassette subfamily B protein n=1 Tax=Bisgaardia hudsonensis TaxID=109472 RepID=A0A4R2MYS9_9PAST|nr:ABC transporter ATP-binding protein [Bisgaardia hudsonensis]QLB12169.1 ABC transporter ATP-binding protein [Bisgaardia hudsonensis]TCP12206.1 ATP-binding cassette subfamily B protein [Bisgaardia hudsonensis]
MIKFFQRYFALSESGAKDLRTAIFSHTLLNLSIMLPVMLAFIFLEEYLNILEKNISTDDNSLWFYLIFSIFSFIIMYAIAYIDYAKLYTKIYTESSKRRIKLAETLRELPMSFFSKKDTADLSAVIMEDTEQIEGLFSHAVPQIFAAIISMTLISFAMFLYDWRMSLAMFWVVPISFLVFYLSKKRMENGHYEVYNQKRIVTETIQEGIEMIQEIKGYNQESTYMQSLDKELDNFENKLIKGELMGGALLNSSYVVLKLGLPSIIFVGAFLFIENKITLFSYLVFLIIIGRIYDPFIETMNNFAALLYLKVRINRIKEMDSMSRQTGLKEFSPDNFDIKFKNVDFSYQENQKTLKNINFTAKQGEITALIGTSGSGKSTIAKLATRFWDIDKGQILLGNQDIKEISPEILLKYFSIVFQDVVLFNTSIMENIRLGRKNATDDEVKEAARLAQCTEFINKLPKGYETVIGENGEKLSGGERQRISIARALLKDAPIILLDEATANLDARNERKIQQAISELIKNKTVLIIAHRMRTIINADRIISLEAGRIVENDTPQVLRTQNGIFASMINKQQTFNKISIN